MVNSLGSSADRETPRLSHCSAYSPRRQHAGWLQVAVFHQEPPLGRLATKKILLRPPPGLGRGTPVEEHEGVPPFPAIPFQLGQIRITFEAAEPAVCVVPVPSWRCMMPSQLLSEAIQIR